MADDTPIKNASAVDEVIATDHLSNLNGTPITPGPTTPKAQRSKAGYGDDGFFRDVSLAFPMPVAAGVATGSAVTTMQSAVVAVGAGTPLAVAGYGTALLQVSGTFAATTVFEASANGGASYSPISATQVGAGDIFSSTTIPGLFRITTTGIDLIQARVSAFASGAVTVTGRATNAINASKVVKLATSGNAIGTVVVTSAPTTAVTGTFFQATQPVSLAVNTPDVTDRAARLLGVLSTGANTVGNVGIVAGAAAIGTVGVTSLPATPAGANSIGTVQQAALTKGTQGGTGVTTQDLKDAGRALVTYYTLIPVLTSATDTLQSLTGTKAAATVVATTTPAVVTTGKTFRIQRFAATYVATATSGYGVVRLRYNPAGIVAITSPVLLTLAVGSGAPTTANAADTEDAAIPDGLEVGAGAGIGISVQGFAAVTATAVGYIMCTVSGYEY